MQSSNLHSCLFHVFHQQIHELLHSGFCHWAIVVVIYHLCRKANVCLFLWFPPIELCSQPIKKTSIVYKKNTIEESSKDILSLIILEIGHGTIWDEKRKLYLTDSPRFSPLSVDTLSATAIAEILRGCVQIILQKAPRPDSISDSNTNWGNWVVLPHPVSPDITIT